MEEQHINKIKSELEDTIESEMKEEIKENRLNSFISGQFFFSKFKGSFITFLAIIIALGEYSEAVALINDGTKTIQSEFTNDLEYDVISKIHVGNTVSYMESILGNPQVSRMINEDVNANYFYDDKYLLTLFYKNTRIVAFTVLPLVEDFHPEVTKTASSQWILGKANFLSFPANPQSYTVDHATTASYYLESFDKGRTGFFVQSYLGKVSYTIESVSTQIVELYNTDVHGIDREVLKLQTKLRQTEIPNFYGEGELGLELIEKSILTGAEFNSYFGLL